MSLSPSGSSPSSCTLWARRIGSSSARNCDARKSVPNWCTYEPQARYSTFDYMYLLMVFHQTGPFDGGLHPWLERTSSAWWFPSASQMPSTPYCGPPTQWPEDQRESKLFQIMISSLENNGERTLHSHSAVLTKDFAKWQWNWPGLWTDEIQIEKLEKNTCSKPWRVGRTEFGLQEPSRKTLLL